MLILCLWTSTNNHQNMCGKAKSNISASKIAQIINRVQLEESNGVGNMNDTTHFSDEPLTNCDNIIPGMTMYVAYIDNENNKLNIEEMRWGFYGYGANSRGFIFNTRCESLIGKKTLSYLINANRGLVIINGYYENKKFDSKITKDNYYITNQEEMLILPVLYKSQDCGKKLFTILTKEASMNIKSIHGRQPVILKKNYVNHWLNINVYDKYHALEALF